MLRATTLSGLGGGNQALAKQVAFAGSTGESGSGGTSWSFPNIFLGRPAANRSLIVAAFGSASLAGPGFIDCGVDGQAASLAVQESDRLIQNALYCLRYPTGWYGRVTLTASATMSGAGFYLLPVYGLAASTPSDSASSDTLFATSRSVAIDCPAGGLIVGAVIESDQSHGIAWSGLAQELVDLQIGSSVRVGIACEFVSGAQVGRTVTASWTSNVIAALSVASWAAA